MTDTIELISILVVLLTFLFNLSYPKIVTIQNRENPNEEKRKERSRLRKEIHHAIMIHILPISIAFSLLFYLCLPKTKEILFGSVFVLWDFCIQTTLFVFLESANLVFIVVLVVALIRLVKKSCKLRQHNLDKIDK